MANNDEFESVDDGAMNELREEAEESYRFWSLTVNTGEVTELDQPEFDAIIRVTVVSYGVKVEKNSRSVLLCKELDDEDNSGSGFSPVCVLNQGSCESMRVDLRFDGPHSFQIKGTRSSPITLTGFLQPRSMITPMPSGPNIGDRDELDAKEEERIRRQMEKVNDDDDDEDVDVDADIETGHSNLIRKKTKKDRKDTVGEDSDDGDKEEEEEEAEEEEEEEEVKVIKKVSPKKKTVKTKAKSNGNKVKANSKAKTKTTKDKNPENAEPNRKKRKYNDIEATPVQSEKTNDNADKPTPANKSNTPKRKKAMKPLKNGITYRDLREGKGDVVEKGNTVSVKYVGQLDDGTVFDKCLTSKGFSFQIGEGDVIKGWDVGLNGLAVGAKRKLKIPPKLAYGVKGNPPTIPPNSFLTFTIEILSSQ